MVTPKRMEIDYGDVLDKDRKPVYVAPPGAYLLYPLRLTTSEWIDLCIVNGEGIHLHPKFTMITSMEPCLRFEYDLQIRIACPAARPQRVTYGPYERGTRRAIERAGEYLIQYKALELIDMPEGANPREWINAAIRDAQTR